MADWDPFAIDASAAAPPPGRAAEAGGEGAKGRRIERADLDRLAGTIYKQSCEQRPWVRIVDPSADLSWYQPSCTLDDWPHKDVKVETGQGIAYVTFCRPDANNVLNSSMYAGLCDAVFLLHERKDIRCVVFSGEGKLFCGGSDPKFDGNFVTHKQSAKAERAVNQLRERAMKAGALKNSDAGIGKLLQAKLWYAMSTLPQFSIALVNGSAIGDGVGCLACVDMVISVSTAFFALPEVRDGLVQCILAPYIVSKVGLGMAKAMLGSGMTFSVDQMRRAGLISEVVDSVEAGHTKVAEICEVLTACGPRSVEAAKQLVVGVGGQPITERVMFFTAALLAMVTVSDESRDGMVCVQQKKPKPWEEKPITPLH
mmetsp:Transcript_117963/g.338322  ORF Transcript_117963/g.338322 Transcript_117963/m.338322 type:complete len:370 (+) Transcript_117963:41-1150(+)